MKVYLKLSVLIFALTLAFVTGCDPDGAEDQPDVEGNDVADASPDVDADAGRVDPHDIATGPLEVGYARVEMAWRAGAKPGQVGTSATDEMESRVSSALSDLIPIVSSNLEPPEMLDGATQWNLDLLDEELEATEDGEYARLFEPGLGLEVPPDVKALVIKRGPLKVAIVRADLYLMHEYIQRRVADLIEGITGIGRDELFLVATHNHSAAQPSYPAPGVWSLADGFDPRHFVYISHRIAEAIIEADGDLRPARLRAHRDEFREVQFNIIGPTTVELAPDEPEDAPVEEIHVGYPYDHFDGDLDLMYFDEADAPHEPIALVFSLGMHPETLPDGHGLTSGDFPIHVETHLRRRRDVPAIWLPGALGDIEPDRARNNPDHDFWRHSFGALHQMSHILAEGVEKSFDDLLSSPDVEAETEPEFRNHAIDIPGTEDFPIPTSAYLGGFRVPTPRALHGSTLIRLHAIRLGDALLLGIPAEVTTDLSYNIKSRVGAFYDEVYQGYVYPDNPEWVARRVANNFTTSTVDDGHSAPIPIVTSMVNGYIGYIVTRWEYENREHYRMHMTSHGPGTADHVASHMVALVDDLMGGTEMVLDYPDWLDDDLQGVDQLMEFLTDLDEEVAQMARQIPVVESDDVGVVLFEPELVDTDEIRPIIATDRAVAFGWRGGSSDSPPPGVVLERFDGENWTPLQRGPGPSIHLLYDDPNHWTARWFPAYETAPFEAEDELRFRIDGQYRGDTAGVSPGDPIWDPDGAEQSYEVVSASFHWSDLDD